MRAQLLGEHALFQGELFGCGACAECCSRRNGRRAGTAPGGAIRWPGTRARCGPRPLCRARIEHTRFDLLAGQGCRSRTRCGLRTKRDAAAVVGQALDAQALLFTGGDLRGPGCRRVGRKRRPASRAWPSVGRVVDAGRQVTVATVADDRDDHRVLDFPWTGAACAATAPPEDTPQKMPSSRARRRVTSSASACAMSTMRSTRSA
jgi:hypothetical protein